MARTSLRLLAGAALVLSACSGPRAEATVDYPIRPRTDVVLSAPTAEQPLGTEVRSPSTVGSGIQKLVGEPLTAPQRATTTPPASDAQATLAPPSNKTFIPMTAIAAGPLAENLEISASLWVEGYGEVWSHNPARPLFPASTQKLLTAAGALNELGSGHAFRTEVRRRGPSLYLVAGGDPTLTTSTLSQLARATVAALPPGTSMEELVVDVSRYEDAVIAPGWQDWQMPTYTGPLSALMLDDNRWTRSEEFIASPANGNGERFRGALRAAGLNINAPVTVGAAPTATLAVAHLESAPVEDLVTAMLLSSDNQIAESLVREVAAAAGKPRASTSDGLATIRVGLVEAGVPVKGELGDGSGLSRSNRWSARDWQGFLVAARTAPWFDTFSGSLPVGGRSGTLRNRFIGTLAAGNVRAKTGTIIGGRALSGYFTTAQGRDAVFSITINGEPSHAAMGLLDTLTVEMVQRSSELGPQLPAVPTGP